MLFLILSILLFVVLFKMSPYIDFIEGHCIVYYTFKEERKYFYLW